jgi:sec-independent protein translocase protein TatC
MNDGHRLPFAAHLEELRSRLLKSLLALAAGIATALAFPRQLLEVAVRPHDRAMSMLGLPGGLAFTEFPDPVRSTFLLAFVAGALAASPVILAQAWAFLRTGLLPAERRWIRLFAPASLVLFAAGAAAGYFVLVPYALYGMAGLVPPDRIRPAIVLGRYLELLFSLTVALGALFQVPLVMLFLARTGWVDADGMARLRRQAWVGAFLVGALLGPGDPVSLALLSIPPLLLYESGLWLARLRRR